MRTSKDRSLAARVGNNTWKHDTTIHPLNVVRKPAGGTWSNHSNGKVMTYHVVEKTPITISNANAYIKRSQLGNQTWKQCGESRLIRSILDAGTFVFGGSWTETINWKSLWYSWIEMMPIIVSTSIRTSKDRSLTRRPGCQAAIFPVANVSRGGSGRSSLSHGTAQLCHWKCCSKSHQRVLHQPSKVKSIYRDFTCCFQAFLSSCDLWMCVC